MLKPAEYLSIHGDRHSISESPGNREQHERVVDDGHVVADEQERSSNAAEMPCSADPGTAENPREGHDERIHEEDSQPAERPALLPARVRKGHGLLPFPLTNHPFDISESRRFGKGRLVELDLVAVLEGAEQFDSTERVELEIGTERRGGIALFRSLRADP
jgi:hypothetical protein